MRVAQVTTAHGPIELADRPIPDPGPGKVRLKVEACGICHSDVVTKESLFPGIVYPRIPGHEVTGTVDALGEGVTNWTKGQRVGVGWIGGHCTICNPCRRGDFAACQTAQIPGIYYDGGYQEYMITSAQGLAALPDALSFTEAAPLLCAGITTYSPMHHWGVTRGQKVGIVGLGGLGHMGVKFAHALGAHTVLFTTSPNKKEDALRLGADEVVVSRNAEEMAKHAFSFDFILDAVSAEHDINAYLNLLRRDGHLCLVGAPEKPLSVAAFNLIFGRRSLSGSPIGGIAETQQMLDFCGANNITADVEVIPIQKVNEAYNRLQKSDVKYRFVIDMASLKK